MTTKIKFNTKALITALDTVTKLTQKKTTLPITEYLYFNVKKAACLITVNNLEIIANVICTCEADQEIKFLLHNTAVEPIKLLLAEEVVFEVNPPSIKVAGGFDSLSFSSVNCEEFPLPKPDYKKGLEAVPLTKEIMESIEKAGEFVAKKEAASLRPIFTCVAIIVKNNKMSIYGTDTCGLYRRIFALPEPLPEKKEIKLLISDTLIHLIDNLPKDNNLSIQYSQESIAIKSKTVGVEYFAKPMVIESIPNYDAVISNDTGTVIHFNHSDLKHSVDLAISMGKDMCDALVISLNDKIQISRESQNEQKKSSGFIEGTYMTERSNLVVGFNPLYFKKAIACIKTPKVSCDFSTPRRPVIVRPVLDGNCDELILIMPMKLSKSNE